MSKHLAIDLGASSYRMILSDGQTYREVARGNNHLIEYDGIKYWDIKLLYNWIIKNLENLTKAGESITSLAINSWGCDFAQVLESYEFDIDGYLETEVLSYSYLNPLTQEKRNLVDKVFPGQELFELTGINKQDFNSIYRLPNLTEKIGFIASYLNMLLTGYLIADPTIVSTTQLLDIEKDEYNEEILRKLNIDIELLPEIVPGGSVKLPIRHDKFKCINVIFGAGHDTSYALYAAPRDSIVVNIGSWVIVGMNIEDPLEFNSTFNYERGVGAKYKVVKNIIGMNGYNKLISELNLNSSFEQITKELKSCNERGVLDIESLDISKGLIEQIGAEKSAYRILGEYLNSLAHLIAQTVLELHHNSQSEVNRIVVVGGGSKNDYLLDRLKELLEPNYRLTIGESEATVKGNIKYQIEVENGSLKS